MVHNSCIDELGKFINSSKADDLLSTDMKGRYDDLLNWQKTGVAKDLLEAEERAKVVLEIIKLRRQLIPMVKGNTDLLDRLRRANIVIGEYSFKGMKSPQKFISISGVPVSDFLATNSKRINLPPFGDLLIIKDVEKNSKRFFPSIPVRAQDSEAKIIQHIGEDIQKNFKYGIDDISVANKSKDIDLQIFITSEMHPCKSCNGIIKEFNTINSNNKINLRYGTDYKE